MSPNIPDNAAEAISASKCVPSTGQKYALRVNPSSGNLHPTEFHFFTRGLKGNPDGLYHYDPSGTWRSNAGAVVLRWTCSAVQRQLCSF